MHGVGRVVPSPMVVESGAIKFVFFFRQYRRCEPQWTRGWCRIPMVMGSEQVKVWWLVWLSKGMVWPG